MAAAPTINDYFLKVGNPGSATTLSAPGYTVGNPTINVGSTGAFPTSTAVIFSVDTVSTTTGTQVENTGSYCVFVGIVTSATSIGSVTLLYGTPQNYSAAATTRVFITVSSQHTNRLITGILQQHNQDGTHGALTSTNATLTTPKIITSLNDTNGNELLKVTATTSAINEFTVANATTGNAPVLSVTSSSDTNSDLRLAPLGTGNVKRGATGGAIDWWEELGRTKLTVAGDVITVTGIAARKYLKFVASFQATAGTVHTYFTVNNDTSTNYSYAYSVNNGANTTAINQGGIANMGVGVTLSAGDVGLAEGTLTNVATLSKNYSGRVTYQSASSPAFPATWIDASGGWFNTSVQISRFDLINDGAGDFAIGSEVIILGHD